MPDALRPSNIVLPTPSKESHTTNGIICSSNSQTVSKPSGVSLTTSSQNPSSNPLVASSFEINFVSSDKGKYQQQLGSKNKGKGKKKKYSSPQEKQTNLSSDDK